MSRWFNWFLAFISAVASVFGIGQFFGVDWKWLREQVTAHYIFAVVSVVSLAIFAWSVHALWKRSRITPDNVQARIRGWLDAFNYTHRVISWHAWHFGFEVTIPRGPLLLIARPIERADSLVLIGKITAVSPRQRVAFDALSESERQEFYGQMRLETARAKILFYTDASLDQVSIEKWIPITSKLTASSFVEAINEMYFSANIIWATIALRFGERPQLTQPSSTPDTEASPPLPT